MLLFSTNDIKAQHEIPDNIKDHISKGLVAFESAKKPEDLYTALIEFINAARIAPAFADVHYYLGETYSMLQGNAALAEKELKKYLELYPDAPDKTKITEEISLLDKAVKTKHSTSLRGIELISLKDGIYVKRINQMAYTDTDYAFYARGGINVGDKLVKINNTNITGLTLQAVINLIDKEPENRIIARVVRGGNEIPSVLIKTEKNNLENIFDLGEEDLNEIAFAESTPAIVIFWDAWSKECLDYIPMLKTAAKDYKGRLRIITVNVDENGLQSWANNISKVPTVFFIKDKKLIGTITGYQPEILKEKIDSIDKITEQFKL